MKKRHNQTGSTHVVIIIILVLAVLGLLGFVFWQNFIEKKATTTPAASTATVTTTTTASTTPKTTATSLALTNYAVEVPYDSSTDTYTVTPITTGSFAGGYTVYSKKVTDACGADVNVGKIARFNPGDAPTPSSHVTIGNYEYALGVGGYGNCPTDAGMTTLNDASTAFSNAFNNLKASH